MGRSGDKQVEKVLTLALRGQPLRAAWEKCGEPGTWGNVGRRFNLLKRQADDASAAAEATPANKRPKKAPNGASLGKRGRGNEAALQSGGSGSAQQNHENRAKWAMRQPAPFSIISSNGDGPERCGHFEDVIRTLRYTYIRGCTSKYLPRSPNDLVRPLVIDRQSQAVVRDIDVRNVL